MGDVLIGGLMIGDCSARLCLRASRFWDFYDPHDETKLLHSDLVLIDEEVYSAFAYLPLSTQIVYFFSFHLVDAQHLYPDFNQNRSHYVGKEYPLKLFLNYKNKLV